MGQQVKEMLNYCGPSQDLTQPLKDLFNIVNEQIRNTDVVGFDAAEQGSTGTVCILRKNPKDNTLVLWCAWVGDSRAILC